MKTFEMKVKVYQFELFDRTVTSSVPLDRLEAFMEKYDVGPWNMDRLTRYFPQWEGQPLVIYFGSVKTLSDPVLRTFVKATSFEEVSQ